MGPANGGDTQPLRDWAAQRGIIIEVYQVSKVVKVSAIDPKTLTEVSVSGPAHYPEPVLVNNALRKLRHMLSKQKP